MQPAAGGSYVRKQDGKWGKSDDWGETSKPAPAKVTADFDNWIGLVNAPLNNIHVELDKSQGGVVPTILEGEGGEDKEIVFELRREHSTNLGYPQFGFVPFGGKALIHSFNGPMHYGSDHVQAHFRYDFLFKVNVQMQEATPAASPSGSVVATVSAAASGSPASTATLSADDQSSGGEEVIKAACRQMQRGSWKVDAKLTFKKKLGITGLINGADFDLATHPEDGSAPMRQVAIMTLSWLSTDNGKNWKKTDAKDRGIYNWVHSPLIGGESMPAFMVVGNEPHGGETWQHLQLKPDEKVDDPSRLPNYWVVMDAQGEPAAVRHFAGPVLISGQVVQAEIDYAASKEPWITPPMMPRR